MTKKCLKLSIKTTIPVFLGYLVCGIAFGLITVNAGYPWWLSTLMSLFIYAGAGQFAAIPLFVANTPIIVILLTELLLNIRHIVYGLPLISQFNNCKKWKPYLIFSLTDETFSLLTTSQLHSDISVSDFFGMISLLNHFYWIFGSTLGALIGVFIPFDLTGINFALTALFAVLTVDQLKKFFSKGEQK